MLELHAAGRLTRTPVTRCSANGNQFVTATVLAQTRQGDSAFINMIAFGESGEVLEQLQEGDGVSVVGSVQVQTWRDRDTGEPRIGFDLLISRLLALVPQPVESKSPATRARRFQRRRKAAAQPAAAGDDLPFDDAISF